MIRQVVVDTQSKKHTSREKKTSPNAGNHLGARLTRGKWPILFNAHIKLEILLLQTSFNERKNYINLPRLFSLNLASIYSAVAP